jgi:hypothetical protein
MFNNRLVRATMVAATMALPLSSVPASAQRPDLVGVGNLVNVQVGEIEILNGLEVRNVLNDLTVSVGVAANIAANVCGVAVGVLASDLAHGNDFSCETAEQFVDITQ